MDANGQRFWQLADSRQFPDTQHVAWDAACRVLRLTSERSLVQALAPVNALAVAQAALAEIPRAVDALECVAFWDSAAGAVKVTSYLPDPAVLLPLALPPSDLCLGYDGVLYVAGQNSIRLHDLRGRWEDTSVNLAGFVPWRMAPIESGGVWVLERSSGRLARLVGLPLRRETPRSEDYDPRVFRPDPENCHVPHLQLVAAPEWSSDEQILGLATLPGSGLVLLSWRGGAGAACVRRWLESEGRPSAPIQLQGADYAYAIAGLSSSRFALRIPGRRDAPAFDIGQGVGTAVQLALGDVYPLADGAVEAAFANGPASPSHYPVGTNRSQPLFPLSVANLARRGEARNFNVIAPEFKAWMIDSGDTTTVWHRLYAEAGIPAHCGFVVWLAAGNEAHPPDEADLTQWHAHGFGEDIASLDPALRAPQVPCAAWERQPSELPGHPGFLGGTTQPGSRGLFTVLIQNTRQRVRRLVGRYLWVHLVMLGDGHSSPEIAAVRAWGSRFDYGEHYLPRIYRESLSGDAASALGVELARIEALHSAALDAGGELSPTLRARLLLAGINPGLSAEIIVEKVEQAWLILDNSRAWRLQHVDNDIVVFRPQASPADFNARLLGNFEGILTPLEDRVAAAHLLSDPNGVPDENLDWLGAWIGIAFDPILPAERRRDWLRAAPELARWHGTRQGLRLALDVATGGSVRSGEIVVIEAFRLRRILATLLGVDLSDENDPLLPGLAQSGNSVVGDTLFVGDHERAELLALFNVGAANPAENQAVLDFYGRLANRATVLVHNEVDAQNFALIRRIARFESPAHVEVSVTPARWPLLVGIASLVGVDTYLGPPRQPRPVQLERSSLGISDFLIGMATLDPRLAGVAAAATPPPVADAGQAREVPYSESFNLDGSGSHAAPGRKLTQYIWRRLPQN